MPELPEVETVVRTLEKRIQGQEILAVHIRWPGVIEGQSPEEFARRLTHQHFRVFHRRGKYLLFDLDRDMLVVHLRMEGKFYVDDPGKPLDRHMHVLFDLGNGRQLRYHDVRKFGRMSLLPLDTDLTHFHDLGPEPWDEGFNAGYVYRTAHSRRQPLKSLLLDQSFVAGIGNIYADEILFACQLRPGRASRRLTHAQAARLVAETQRILSEAIRAGGTTIRTYTSSLGVSGRFQLQCMVHEQKFCRVCGSPIHCRRIGGRSSYYCPHCQK